MVLMEKLLPTHVTPAMQELYCVLLKSEKFVNWNKPPDKLHPRDPAFSVDEKHFTPQQLADAWGVSVQMIREIFDVEEGVLKLGSDGTRTRRRYKTLRIPREVAERVHRRLSA
jgi:hypothetical protein